MATKYSRFVDNLFGFNKLLTDSKYYISVFRYVESNNMEYFSPHALFLQARSHMEQFCLWYAKHFCKCIARKTLYYYFNRTQHIITGYNKLVNRLGCALHLRPEELVSEWIWFLTEQIFEVDTNLIFWQISIVSSIYKYLVSFKDCNHFEAHLSSGWVNY